MEEKLHLAIFVGILFLVGGFSFATLVKQSAKIPLPQIKSIPANPLSVTPPPHAPSSTALVLGARTKTTDCTIINSLPDKDCTPGAVFESATKDDICTPGYSKTVRNVPQATKDKVFAEYGIASHLPGDYEVDHLISLELGGSNEIANLWPEPADPRPGFHEKDTVENWLHDQICEGKIDLKQAQLQIAGNWLEVYQNLPH